MRVERLRKKMSAEGLPAVLVQNPFNVSYLSGFTGSTAVLLVTPERQVFITDTRYQVQAARECPEWERAITARGSGTYPETISEQIKALGLSQVVVEADYLTLAALEKLREKLEGVELKPVSDVVSPLRVVKDAEEIGIIRAACGIVDRAFEYALGLLRPGASERDVALDLNYWMMKNGADSEGFETIVVSGDRSALPHGRPSEKRIQPGDLVTLDFGAKLSGYTSDITRTVVVGKATDKQREVYETVLGANEAAIAAIRPGAEGKAIDGVARDFITQRGYGDYFGHGLGHGLGLHVHDHVCLSQVSTLVLEPGIVTTVEPGVYIEGWGGVRIEDDVLVTQSGHEVLTTAPKHLIELPA